MKPLASPAFTLPANGFTAPANKVFANWMIGSGSYAAGAVYKVGADTTVVAVWKDTSAPAHSGGGRSDASSGKTTVTNPDGSMTVTTTNPDGSKAAVTTAKDGSVTTVKTDKTGNLISVEADPSAEAIETARRTGEPIRIPAAVPVVSAANAASATPIRITLPSGFDSSRVADMPRVEIEVSVSGPGVVAMETAADGTLTPIRECYEGSVIFPVARSCEIVIVDNAKSFEDVSASDWFYEGVTFVTAREIFNGVGGGRFDPSAAMTRGMLAQALCNFDRSAAPNGAYAFADAAGKWYADAASWAASVGVVTGTDRGFEGEANVTREQAALMLCRYAKLCGYDVSASGDLSAYGDASDVSDWARDAMCWAVGVGLISGTQNGTSEIVLDPQGSATRAQLAAIIERFCVYAAK